MTTSPLYVNMGYMTKIDIGQLKAEIRVLNRHKLLYRVLRDELTKIGHWKQRPRGNPMKAYLSRGKSRG